MKQLIFVSSVQRELAAERRAVAEHVRTDPLLRRFFDVFLFEELPPKDRKADELYLEKVDQAAVYVGLFGDDYGSQDGAGPSPTEREFERATARGIPRLIFIKGPDDEGRHPKMRALVRRAEKQLIRRRFRDHAELLRLFQQSLVDHLESSGIIQDRVFEERPCPDARLGDIDREAVARFVRRARSERRFPLAEEAPTENVLAHLNLLRGTQPTMAAILLFGRDPQRFVPAAEIRCMHFHGTEVQRPAPSYQVFKGRLFDHVDRGLDFVLSVLNRRIGTRAHSVQVPVSYEIPPDVVREAIVNAVAHRDYASAAAVQVSVFADRVEVWSPGALPAELTPESLRKPHASIARNGRICEALFLTRYIEKYGTGTLMMIDQSVEAGLPAPVFDQRGAEFVVGLWRDWLTDEVMARLALDERQKQAIAFVKRHGRITNRGYQTLTGVAERTALRDLTELSKKGVLEKVGDVGRGAHYILRLETRQEPAKPATPSARRTRQKPASPAGAESIGKGDGKGTSGPSAGKTGRKRDKRDTARAAEAGLETKAQGTRDGLTKGSKGSSAKGVGKGSKRPRIGSRARKPAHARKSRRGQRKPGSKGRGR